MDQGALEPVPWSPGKSVAGMSAADRVFGAGGVSACQFLGFHCTDEQSNSEGVCVRSRADSSQVWRGLAVWGE